MVHCRREFLASVARSMSAAGVLVGSRNAYGQTDNGARVAEIVSLRGDARSVGEQFGRLNAEDIRKHTAHMIDHWRKRGLSDDELVARSRPFHRFAEKFAPAWLDEIEACSNAAGVLPEDFLAYQTGKYRSLFFAHECTSFAAVGAATEDGAAIFHKNRDNYARDQSAYKKKIIDSSNSAGYYAIGDTSDVGVMMMVNEHGLAGSADMGGLPEDRPKGDGVMNPHILRLIAERAERCEDALEIIQQTVRDGWYAGGKSSGTHWLFADRHGKALRVAHNSHEEQHWFYEDDVVFLARGKTEGAGLAREKMGHITVRDINAAASHPDICNCGSISALTVRIDPESPADLSGVWVALPAWSPYVPLYPMAQGVPRAVLDGTWFRKGYQMLSQHSGTKSGGVAFSETYRQWRSTVQEEIYSDDEKVTRQIRTAYDDGSKDLAQRIANDALTRDLDKAMAFPAGVPAS